MKNKIKVCLLVLAMVILLPFQQSWAMEPVMDAGQLTAGMHGYAKTVISGTEITTFDIEILGVIGKNKVSEGRILARASGPVIEQTGGVLQGMSGSPVYINGYLVGAVSGGWKDIDNRLCIITPINDMLKIWNLPDTKNVQPKSKINLKEIYAKEKKAELKADKTADEDKADKADEAGKADDTGKEAEAEKTAEKTDTADNAADSKPSESGDEKPLATPLLVSGLTDSAVAMLAEQVKPYGLVPYAVGTSDTTGFTAPLQPGSAIGAALIRGDLSIAAIGTVTAVDGNKVLAFGHSFMHRGNASYFMTEADIVTTASGVNSGFKIGTPGRVVGLVNQDRNSGIAGVIGKFPQIIPLKVNIKDKTLNREQTYGVQMAYNEPLVPAMTATVVYNAIDQFIDRATECTVKISYEILSNDGGGKSIKRDNMYYAVQKAAELSVNEIVEMTNLLCSNTMKEADIYGINVNVEVEQARKTASIIEVKPEKTKVKPGEKINLTIKVKPYRAEAVTYVMPYTVPDDMSDGPALLEVHGGGLVAVKSIQLMQTGIDMTAEEDKTKSLEKSVQELLKKRRNNEIVVETVIPIDENGEPLFNKKHKKKLPKAKTPAQVQADKQKNNDPSAENENPHEQVLSTDYIIDNVMRASLVIEEKKK